ncbi:hypothetical protein MTR_3g073740 [Medicago truncatula]|uniref:Uncharacterized protein n=1 Tax=Medicago truncatula TaxID=3880 RepID=A0A072UZP1_MEDTR|nr:hypothetical protein MTR_3g073740 [Medicago truncatula]
MVWACREKTVDAVVRSVYQMEESQVKRGRGRPTKTIRETIRNDLEVIGRPSCTCTQVTMNTEPNSRGSPPSQIPSPRPSGSPVLQKSIQIWCMIEHYDVI